MREKLSLKNGKTLKGRYTKVNKALLLLLALPVITVIAVYYLITYKLGVPTTPSAISPTPTATASTLKKLKEIKIEGTAYRYTFIEISPNNIRLYPNFDIRQSAKNLVSEYSCSFLTNGSYYSEENKPLGWIVSQGKEIAKENKSLLMNSYLSISNEGRASLSFEKPNLPVLWGLQTGPMLVANKEKQLLEIKNDEEARRVVVGITEQNTLIFTVIVGNSSVTDGPFLKDLPDILTELNKQENINLTSATNLDGGSASAFITEDVAIYEYTWIGSFFCYR